MTDTTLTSAGFIVCDDTAIWGYGSTREAAWADMLRGMQSAGIEVVDEIGEEDHLSPFGTGNKTEASKFTTGPATAALLEQVEGRGGNIAWGEVGGVYCTRDEEDEAA